MKIKNIIFDLGGVILNLDQEKTHQAFKKLGADLNEFSERLPVFLDFETGKISAEQFKRIIHTELKGSATDSEIENAWNSMLLDLPPERVELVKSLGQRYRLFLLSNTNSLHMNAIYKINRKEVFEILFEKIYLSHEIGLRKPNLDCYEFVLNDAKLIASETVFIDDSKINLEGASKAGLKCIWSEEPLNGWIEARLSAIESPENLSKN